MKKLEPWSREWRHLRLHELYQQWRDCDKCRLHETRKSVVFGSGHPNADIMLIGEGPGEDEDATGDPFVGESGKVLTALLEAVGLSRSDVFITNLVMCRPPENRDPIKDERYACLPRLHEQIYLVDPLLVIPVGKIAMKALMGGSWLSIKDKHGQIGEIKVSGRTDDYRVDAEKGITYPAMPIFHPAFILRVDTIDSSTNSWRAGGEGRKTYEDLNRALQIVTRLKDEYQQARKRTRKQNNAQTRLKVVK